MMNPLKRASPGSHSAETTFVLTIKTEEKSVHEAGKLTSASVDVCGNLKTDQPPSLSTFVNAAKGGLDLIDSMVELGAGWLQNMWTPSSCATLVVEFEEVTDWKIDNTFSAGGTVAHFTGLSCGSPYGPWEIKEEGTIPQNGISFGTIKIPFAADGKSTAAFDMHLRIEHLKYTADVTANPSSFIVPVGGNYQLTFGAFTYVGTSCVPEVCAPAKDVENPAGSVIQKIVPAGQGECKK